MYRLVIVEDEIVTRQGMERYFDWKRYGFEVVNAFPDGMEALAWIKNNACDVVITDIMMSRLDGLELAARLRQTRPEIKVIILSGYSTFDYAKQAIQNKVVEYLLKPIDEDDLARVLQKLKKQLDEENQEKNAHQTKNKEILLTLRQSFFKNLLSGQINTRSELNTYFRLLNIAPSVIEMPILAYEISLASREEDGLDDEEETETRQMKNVGAALRRQFESREGEALYYVWDYQELKWSVTVIALSQTKIEALKQLFCEKLRAFSKQVETEFGECASFRLTHAVQRIGDLVGEARAAAAVDDASGIDGEVCESLLIKYRVCIVEMDLEHDRQLLELLDHLERELSAFPLEQARFVVKNLYSTVMQEYQGRGVDVGRCTGGRMDLAAPYQVENISQLTQEARAAFCALHDGLKKRKAEFNADIVGLIIQYIDKNIDGELSNDTMAAKYHMHPAYMSRIFRQRTGERLSDYILRIRMEKAVSLLKDGRHSVQKISQMVGYNTATYFSTQFRKYTGYSPREYCQRVLSR